MVKSVKVITSSSTANLGPGFDVFGLALDAFFDQLTLTKKKNGLTIVTSDNIPINVNQNTAGIVIKAMQKN